MSSQERGSKLYGAMVIALKEGQRLGWVSEVYIDKEAKRIQGIAYRSGVWGVDQETYIGFGDILKFGRDFVIVSSQGAGHPLPKEIAKPGLRALKGCKITTHEGRHVATLADLIFDREDGKVAEIILPENRVLQIDIAAVHFGPDLVMVPADYELAVRAAEPEPNDFATRFFNAGGLSHTVREGYEGVKTAVRNNINTEKVKQTLKSGSQTARQTILRTSQAIQQGIDQIMKKRETDKSAQNPANADADADMPLDATKAYNDPNQPDAIDELTPESVAGVEPLDKP